MARRKSNTTKTHIWKAGRYFRLSREDGDKVESDSIDSQRSISNDWCVLQADIQIIEDYIDDGWSGTNFERPGFQKMLQDIKEKRINCVIVKDLSRFGRNYIEVGKYLEMVFPLFDVRFVSINDRIDSFADPYSINNAIVPFKNVMNDEYCRDISNKVRSSLTARRKQGKFIGSFASYGYQKDPQNHSHLIIDEEAAKVVRMIYRFFLGGQSIIGIAKEINAMGIPNPSAYKRIHGEQYHHPKSDFNDSLWPDSSVRRILTNQLYTGDLVQGKNRIKSYKVSKSISVPQDDWIIVKDTHEPIVSKEDFEQVQDILSRNTRTSPLKAYVYPFSGYLKCADCHRAMNRKILSDHTRSYCYYICSTFKKMNRGACTKHTIRSDKLEATVLAVINAHAKFAIEMDAVLRKINDTVRQKGQHDIISIKIKDKQEERAHNVMCMADLYPDWKKGIISQEEYTTIKTRLVEKNKILNEELSRLCEKLKKVEASGKNTNEFVDHFKKYGEIKEITRDVVVELIDVIYVHEGGEITIQFKYQDEYQRLLKIEKQHGRGVAC